MEFIDKDTLRHSMNRHGAAGNPFIWGIDYCMERGFLMTDPFEQSEILWNVGDCGNCSHLRLSAGPPPAIRITDAMTEEEYRAMFSVIRRGLERGDSFLANLTGATGVECDGTLRDVFMYSRAPYRLLIGDSFVCFSPEPFVRIEGRRISTFPMKGTADASVPDAARHLMEDYKELCEHYTIVDLMRNDINSVACDVRVDRFRYLERITTSRGDILQTSSEISGMLSPERVGRFGDIILPLLPAGSITGAPKQATVTLIAEAERSPRGWYTGVFGYFDGSVMRTAVMIRCIQRDAGGRLRFHSGGGITVNSDPAGEYAEMLAKVYLSR